MYGILYLITNKINGKQYVGQTTVSLESRWTNHLKRAQYNPQHSALSQAINKYGSHNFSLETISQHDSQEELDAAEIEAIKIYNSLSPTGYNLQTGGSNGKPSEETRRKMAESMTGFKHSEDTKQLLREKATGRKLSEEHKRKISEGLMGKYTHNERQRDALDVARRRPKSEETKRKISEAKKRNPPVFTEETRRKISEAGKGRKHSEESKQKMRESARNISDETRRRRSEGLKGKPKSEEHKQKLREAKARRREEKQHGIS